MTDKQKIDIEKIYQDTETFRDRIATVDEEGKRIWVYPKKTQGRFFRARTIVSFFLLGFLFGVPFLKLNGQPLILLNVLERKFIIFGLAFWPQDFHLFALAFLTMMVFIILFTVVFGRIFCGWVCPQTIFMEMVFRRIEYWIEGDAHKQRLLNLGPWTVKKILKKLLKFSAFYAIAFLIGNTFLAYIIGIDALYAIVTDPPREHLGGLTAMLVFSTIFFWVFSWFREQVCVMVCPYGRLQGVLLDQNSIVVGYDFKRGEPRAKYKKGASRAAEGDCIGCGLCVQVCPTGIDIKDGTQLECINCTACIDACDAVMDRVALPRGLIRYTSFKGIMEGKNFKFTPRIISYSIVLCMLLGLVTSLLINRTPVETTILRTPGVLYQKMDDGRIQNLYNVKIVNKSFDERVISLRLKTAGGELQVVSGAQLIVPADGLVSSVFFIRLPGEQLDGTRTNVHVEVLSDEGVLETIETSFLGPAL